MFRGIVVSKTQSPKWSRASFSTKPDRLLRRSNIVNRIPDSRSRGLKRRRTASIVCIRLLIPSSA